MWTKLAVLGLAAAGFSVYRTFSSWSKNIRDAKRSGFYTVVSPCSPTSLPWQLFHGLLIPVIQLFPRSWWEEWLEVITPDWSYRLGHDPFARRGGDNFLLVSPFTLTLFVDGAETIHQVAQRREQFPKMTYHYSILRQFGENVLTCEGALWRMHRKTTAASFNERNAGLVFVEAARQAGSMCDKWIGPDGGVVDTVDQDTMRFALNIISYVGFGIRLLWPGQAMPADADLRQVKYSSLDAQEGYTMSFVDSVAMLLHHILLLLLVPNWILRLLPFKAARVAIAARDDYVKYMEELYDARVEDLRNGNREVGMDLVGQMIRSKYGDSLQPNGTSEKTKEPVGVLSKDDILGNSFIMLVAGHETTANTMHFTLLELACNPGAQRQLQRDVDAIFGGADPSTWDFEASVNPLLASMVGACMNETLRLIPPVVEIPKEVAGDAGQTLTVAGKRHWLPRGAAVTLTAVAAHRNPAAWPARPSRIHPGRDDLSDYVPERWFRPTGAAGAGEDEGSGEDWGGYSGPDTSAQLFRPPRGGYVPFSDGPRSCLGRRIAQSEIIAALAVVFQKYSLELAVDAWADEAAVAAMGAKERAELYAKAQAECRKTIGTAKSVLTLKLDGTNVPLRIVKRGEEKFINIVDV